MVLDARTLQRTRESGSRAGYNALERKKGSKTHVAIDTFGNLLAMVVSLANERERAGVGQLTKSVQQSTPLLQVHDTFYFVDTRQQPMFQQAMALTGDNHQ